MERNNLKAISHLDGIIIKERIIIIGKKVVWFAKCPPYHKDWISLRVAMWKAYWKRQNDIKTFLAWPNFHDILSWAHEMQMCILVLRPWARKQSQEIAFGQNTSYSFPHSHNRWIFFIVLPLMYKHCEIWRFLPILSSYIRRLLYVTNPHINFVIFTAIGYTL